MKIITDKITILELKKMSQMMFGNLVKAVVDIDRKIMVVDAPMHSDEEAELLKNGSKQENLWGINLYPEFDNIESEDFIEFDSMINLRPAQNRSRGVEDEKIRNEIIIIVRKLVQK